MVGSDMEKSWLDGRKLTLMNSVDLYGPRRSLNNPAINFIYLSGAISNCDTITQAIHDGYTIAAASFDEADRTFDLVLPQ